MKTSESTIGIVGAGIGGLVAAIALRRAGHDVIVFEQAKQFARVGADINLTPNAVRALDGLGVGEAARVTAARPSHRISRTYDTGEETSRLEMADSAEERYGCAAAHHPPRRPARRIGRHVPGRAGRARQARRDHRRG